MASKIGGAPRMVSLSDLVGRTVPYEDLPAPIDRDLRLGALLGMASVAAYLLALGVVHASVDDPTNTPAFFAFGWGVVRGASFLADGVEVPAVLGLLVLIGGGWLYFHTPMDSGRQRDGAS